MTTPKALAKSKTERSPRSAHAMPTVVSLLRWVYLGRVSTAVAIFIAAAYLFTETPPGVLVTVSAVAMVTLLVTGGSYFHTHIRGVPPGATFLYAQSMFDLGLVTVVVHVTGGASSDFASLYILVIAVSSVTMPITSSLLITILAAVLYTADVVFGNPVQLSFALWLQILVFIMVALVTGYLASRVRVVGAVQSRLEREVRRLRLEAGDILRQIGSGVVTVDGDGTLVFANTAADRLLDFKSDRFVGKPFLERLQEIAPDLERAIAATQGEGRRRVRFSGSMATGKRSFPIGVTTTLHETAVEGERPSVTAVFTDISDQLRIQELNRRTERLEAVAELSASLAHEIKNPLASIRSSIEQLGRSARANDDDRFLADLVLRESDRLSGLLSDFLEFSRVQVRESQPVNLAGVVQTAIEVVRGHPDCSADAEIAVEGTCAPISGDEDLLHRVVTNLVLNALQAGGDLVEVVVTVRDTRAGEAPAMLAEEPSVLLQVSDNGPGIPPDLRDRLFDPFVTGRDGGTGLGLSVVQRAVEAHGGVVLLTSKPGAGTTFRIFLPRHRPTDTTP